MEPGIDTTVLILPGIGNSGPDHWQSRWERANPGFVRVQQRDWDNPVCDEWVGVLEQSVARAGADVVLVAHSLACLLVARWADGTRLKVRGALLVAPPDPDGPNFPGKAIGFSPMPLSSLGFPSVVVASTNDPYADPAFAERAAMAWGSRFVSIGASGHINARSGLGDWDEGFSMLRRFLA